MYGLDGKRLQCQYYSHLSDFSSWEQRDHAEEWILVPQNIGSSLGMDETSLSHGELYTVITNKEAKGKRGALVAMIKGTVSNDVIKVLSKIPKAIRDQVE